MEGPIVQLGTLKFMIEEDFSDGYSGNITPSVENESGTNPINFMWKGGAFKPIAFSVTLFVDKYSNITSSEELIRTVEQIYKYALPSQPAGVPPEQLVFSVGTWYSRTGYVKDVDATYKSPWDLATGMPMRAQVRFTFLVDYSKPLFGGATADQGIADNVSRNPTSSTFKFKAEGAG